MKRVSVLYAALFCAAALSAQEAGAPAAGQAAAANAAEISKARAAEPAKPDTAASADADVKAAEAGAAQADTAAAAPAAAQQAEAQQPAAVKAAPAVASAAPPPLTRADSALGVYRAARDSIISANRKFPRPPRPRQSDDTAKAPRTPEAALASADETIRAAWAAMGVQSAPVPPDTAIAAAPTPHRFHPQAPGSALLPEKPYKAQIAVGLIIPINLGPEEPNFRPWWNMGYHASYREIDADARFSRGVGLDLSLYTFSKEQYLKYYEDTRTDISVSDATPMFIFDLGYHLKFYPVDQYRIPYISGSAGITAAFGGGATLSYIESGETVENDPQSLIEDIYLLNASAGVGIDIPISARIRIFAEIHYSLRLGMQSMFEFKDDGGVKFLGGLVPQMPVRFGVMAPFGL